MSRLGDLILLERTRQKLTRKQVARKCGVSEGYIKDVEEGRRIIQDDQARRILKTLGTSQKNEAEFSLDEIAATVDLGTLAPAKPAFQPKEEPKPEPKPEPKKEQPAPKKEEPKPEPPKETPKKGDPMKLPDKDDKSMDFLDGCWNCRTGLSDTRGNPIKVRFCFGKNGKGQITIIDRQGKTYTGRADAQMQNGRLHIDTGDATSRNSRGSFNGLRIDCSPGAGNDAMCYGRNKGDNSPWSAKFFRD